VSQRIRLLIADDHPVVRAGLQGMLISQSDFEVVGEAVDGAEAVRLSLRLKPDVILMDLRMPKADGVAAIKQLQNELPGARVLVLTTYDSDADILRAVEAGATGYLLKDTPREELFDAIRAAAQGKSTLALSAATLLMSKVRSPADKTLSAREFEVLRLVAKGASNKEIARSLQISEATVKSHLIHIFAKLGVTDRTAAVTLALERGLLNLSD
jgi:DNA-binding NarL/FixJ family response regulator